MEKQSLIDKAVAAFQIRFNNTPKEVGLHIQTVYKDSVIFSPSEKEAMSFITNQKDMQNYIRQCFVFCTGLVVYMTIGLICFTFSPDSFIGFWIGGAILSILFLSCCDELSVKSLEPDSVEIFERNIRSAFNYSC